MSFVNGVWHLPMPVNIAKAVEATRMVRLGQAMLAERALIECNLNVARSEYFEASNRLAAVRKRGCPTVMEDTATGDLYRALDDIWTAQENLKRWEAWFE